MCTTHVAGGEGGGGLGGGVWCGYGHRKGDEANGAMVAAAVNVIPRFAGAFGAVMGCNGTHWPVTWSGRTGPSAGY